MEVEVEEGGGGWGVAKVCKTRLGMVASCARNSRKEGSSDLDQRYMPRESGLLVLEVDENIVERLA